MLVVVMLVALAVVVLFLCVTCIIFLVAWSMLFRQICIPTHINLHMYVPATCLICTLLWTDGEREGQSTQRRSKTFDRQLESRCRVLDVML